MKHSYLFLLSILIISGCSRKRTAFDFSGNTPGIPNGVIILNSADGQTSYGANIRNQKFGIKGTLTEPGYFEVHITATHLTDSIKPFEIYLDNEQYSLTVKQGQLDKYPEFSTTSKKQAELSAFYHLKDSLNLVANNKLKIFGQKLKHESDLLSTAQYNAMLNQMSNLTQKLAGNNVAAMKIFVKKYPGNTVSLHLMNELDYGTDPIGFYSVFKALSPAQRGSDQGKYIDSVLRRLVQVTPGGKSPAIEGRTPDGRVFWPGMIRSKLILVEFWRSADDSTGEAHKRLIKLITRINNPGELGIVSVSLDTSYQAWIKAIKADGIKWLQVSDLKGKKSPNIHHWMIQNYNGYYLLDENWKIIKSSYYVDDVADYIEAHSNNL